jgi:hypothetical protein
LFGRTIRDPESFEVKINTMLAALKDGQGSFIQRKNQAYITEFQAIFASMVAVLTEAH